MLRPNAEPTGSAMTTPSAGAATSDLEPHRAWPDLWAPIPPAPYHLHQLHLYLSLEIRWYWRLVYTYRRIRDAKTDPDDRTYWVLVAAEHAQILRALLSVRRAAKRASRMWSRKAVGS